jgi:hypothetical protein
MVTGARSMETTDAEESIRSWLIREPIFAPGNLVFSDPQLCVVSVRNLYGGIFVL